MLKELTDEQLLKILEKLPEDLKEAVFSPETADYIADVFEKFELSGEKCSMVAGAVGNILLKIAPPEEFSKILEKEIGLKKNQAEDVARELDFRVFSQIRASLAPVAPKTTPEEKISPASAERPPKGPDTYREPLG